VAAALRILAPLVPGLGVNTIPAIENVELGHGATF
jgi:hypothetical protein